MNITCLIDGHKFAMGPSFTLRECSRCGRKEAFVPARIRSGIGHAWTWLHVKDFIVDTNGHVWFETFMGCWYDKVAREEL